MAKIIPFQSAAELQRAAHRARWRNNMLHFPPEDYIATPRVIMYGAILGCAAWGVIMVTLWLAMGGNK